MLISRKVRDGELESGSKRIWDHYPALQITEERGFIYDQGVREEDGKITPVIEPNGDARLCIRAWKGCHSFDSFTSRGIGGQ